MNPFLRTIQHSRAQAPNRSLAAPKWVTQVAERRAAMGIPMDLFLWTPHMQAVGLCKTDRVLAIIELVALEYLAVDPGLAVARTMTFTELARKLEDKFVDVSQNPKYASKANAAGILGCLATSSVVYSYHKDRIILPFELLLCQGHRRGLRVPSGISSSTVLRDAAGEAMNLASLASVVWSMYMLKGLP